LKIRSTFFSTNKQYEKQNGQSFKIIRKCDHKVFPFIKGFKEYVYIIKTEDDSLVLAYPTEVEQR